MVWLLQTHHYQNYFPKGPHWPLVVKFKCLCSLDVCSYLNTLLSQYRLSLDPPDITVMPPAFMHPPLSSSHAYLGTAGPLYPTRWRVQIASLKSFLFMYLYSLPSLNSPALHFVVLLDIFYFILMGINTSCSPFPVMGKSWRAGPVIDRAVRFPWHLVHDRCSKVNPNVFSEMRGRSFGS